MLNFDGHFEVGSERHLPDGLEVANFLSSLDFKKYWAYYGSLTIPPCTEGIHWHILEQVQPISKCQLERFTALWSENPTYAEGYGNNREIQQLNGRTLYYTNGTAVDY